MILQIGNAMIAMMLAKFMFNDLPHASGMIPHTRYDDPPTGPQLSYIARLCTRTGTTIIHEERVTTFGEAGRMIRELQAEEARQKREKKTGNPGSWDKSTRGFQRPGETPMDAWERERERIERTLSEEEHV